MKLIDTFRSKRDTIPSWLFWLSAAATIGLTLLGCWYVMEIPSMIQWDGGFYWQVARPKFIILNLATIGVFWCLLLILFNRVWLANLLCSCVCGCVAIVNYYVIRFHGMPLSFLLLRNFATAMNVLSSYSITLTPDAWKMLAIMLGCILLALAVKFLGAGRKIAISRGYIILRNVVLLMGCFLVVYKGYVCEKSVKPKTPFPGVGWKHTAPMDTPPVQSKRLFSLFPVSAHRTDTHRKRQIHSPPPLKKKTPKLRMLC